jgi:hypothetical protein
VLNRISGPFFPSALEGVSYFITPYFQLPALPAATKTAPAQVAVSVSYPHASVKYQVRMRLMECRTQSDCQDVAAKGEFLDRGRKLVDRILSGIHELEK